MNPYIDLLKQRRTAYQLGANIPLTEDEITDLIKEITRETPTAFNSQSQRIVILFDNAHKKLWQTAEELLKPLTPVEAFSNTQAKLASFAAGKGTILFFEDQSIISNLQEQFPLYADNFPIWSEQSSGMTQINIWNALTHVGVGANLQHYNPIIDEEVAKTFNIPENWKLRGEMIFGSIEGNPDDKEYIVDDERFKVFK